MKTREEFVDLFGQFARSIMARPGLPAPKGFHAFAGKSRVPLNEFLDTIMSLCDTLNQSWKEPFAQGEFFLAQILLMINKIQQKHNIIINEGLIYRLLLAGLIVATKSFTEVELRNKELATDIGLDIGDLKKLEATFLKYLDYETAPSLDDLRTMIAWGLEGIELPEVGVEGEVENFSEENREVMSDEAMLLDLQASLNKNLSLWQNIRDHYSQYVPAMEERFRLAYNRKGDDKRAFSIRMEGMIYDFIDNYPVKKPHHELAKKFNAYYDVYQNCRRLHEFVNEYQIKVAAADALSQSFANSAQLDSSPEEEGSLPKLRRRGPG